MDSINEEKKTEERLDAILRSRMTMEERFDKEFVRDDGLMNKYTYDELSGEPTVMADSIKDFINQEFQSFVSEILGKKQMITCDNCNEQMINGDITEAVTVEDILQIAKERGVEI